MFKNLFKKIHFVKGAKRNLKRIKKNDNEENYSFGLHGQFNLQSTLDNDGNVKYRLVLDGEWDSRQIENEQIDVEKLRFLQKEVEDVLKKFNEK